MIDNLQNSNFAKPDILVSFIRILIQLCLSSFRHVLSLQVYIILLSRQATIQTTYSYTEDGFTRSDKFTMALLDLPIFIEGKDLSIDQCLSKMKDKFEINSDHYPTYWNKLMNVEKRVREIALQYLQSGLCVNSITFFTIFEDLFNHLEDIFGNIYNKKYVMEMFQWLKIGISLYNDLFSEFIYLASDLEYISEMLIWDFKQKLILCLYDYVNSGVKLSNSILILAKRCFLIYE